MHTLKWIAIACISFATGIVAGIAAIWAATQLATWLIA